MYVIIWEFQVKEGHEAEFEQIYGPGGAWAQLFKRGEGYLGTELLRDVGQPRRYLTLDRWRSQTDYEAFQDSWAEAYKELDGRCEGLTRHESLVGALVGVT